MNINANNAKQAQALQTELASLLGLRHPGNQAAAEQEAAQLLGAQLRSQHIANLQIELSTAQWQETTLRCRYFASEALTEFLLQQRQRQGLSVVVAEEMQLYVQEQLLANDFRRLRQFDASKGALFKTWLNHVIARLLIDYRRRADQQHQQVDIADPNIIAAMDHEDESTNPQAQLESADQLSLLLGLLLDPGTTDARQGWAQQLATHLELSQKERLFLKAVYMDGETPEAVGKLPGMALNSNQAYSLQRRLLERIATAFKDAGIYADLQATVQAAPVHIAVQLNGQPQRIAANQLLHLSKLDKQDSQCWFHELEQAYQANITSGFNILFKQHYQDLTQIQPQAAIADKQIHNADPKGAWLKLNYLEQTWPVASRYRKAIKALQ